MRRGCSTSPARDPGCRTRRRPWRGAWRSRSPPRAVEPWTVERAVPAAAVGVAAREAPVDEGEPVVSREPADEAERAVVPEPALVPEPAEQPAARREPAAREPDAGARPPSIGIAVFER